MSNKAKTKAKPKAKKDKTKLDSFDAIGKFFDMPPQKFRVVNMSNPFPRGKDSELVPMTPNQVVEHCIIAMRCGQLMRMKFKADPNKVSYRDTKKSSSSK